MVSIAMPWGSMAYLDSGGTGPPAVLLHGTGCDASDWGATIRALPPPLRVLAPDFRGHGQSSAACGAFTLEDLAEDVIALLDRLALDRVVLAGHSLGGMVAIDVACRTQRIGALALMEGWPRLDCTRAFSADHLYGSLDAGVVACINAKYRATVAGLDTDDWRDFWSSVECFDGMPFLRSTKSPIIAAFGDAGCTDTTLHILDIPDNPSIRLRWIAGAGHYLPHERPADVAALIAEAVTDLTAAAVLPAQREHPRGDGIAESRRTTCESDS